MSKSHLNIFYSKNAPSLFSCFALMKWKYTKNALSWKKVLKTKYRLIFIFDAFSKWEAGGGKKSKKIIDYINQIISPI